MDNDRRHEKSWNDPPMFSMEQLNNVTSNVQHSKRYRYPPQPVGPMPGMGGAGGGGGYPAYGNASTANGYPNAAPGYAGQAQSMQMPYSNQPGPVYPQSAPPPMYNNSPGMPNPGGYAPYGGNEYGYPAQQPQAQSMPVPYANQSAYPQAPITPPQSYMPSAPQSQPQPLGFSQGYAASAYPAPPPNAYYPQQ